MFSVDNFYTFFHSHYGMHKTTCLEWVFQHHGSKDLNDLFVAPFDRAESGGYEMYGSIMLHEQEPVFHSTSTSTYKLFKLQDNKLETTVRSVWESLDSGQIFLYRLRTCSWPIIVHSELNSSDIEYLKNSGYIPAYCFYHGLIARDWFRHWKHHGSITFSKTPQYRFLLYARDFTGTRAYRKKLVQHLTPLRDNILYNAWQKTYMVDSSYSAKIDIEDSQKAGIHLVAETLFDHDKIYLTEKVFKPMVMKQPFLVFSAPHTLATLRRYGFETFHSIWDESYDEVMDHDLRFQMIMQLIHWLNDLDAQRFAEVMKKCEQITQHNHRRFFSEQFEHQMLVELDHNVRSAIDQQKSLMEQDPGGSLFAVYDDLVKRQVILPTDEKIRIKKLLSYLDHKNLRSLLEKYPWISSQMTSI